MNSAIEKPEVPFVCQSGLYGNWLNCYEIIKIITKHSFYKSKHRFHFAESSSKDQFYEVE